MNGQLLSVIVCTYNRCEKLSDVLECLLAQETGGRFDYEIIIVDNNSPDNTRDTVGSFMPRSHGRLRYLFEKRQGKSFALNAAVREARGGILVFTDDDVLLPHDWLLNVRECFESHGCDAVGGRILPLLPDGIPSWVSRYRELLDGPVGAHDYGEEIKPYDRSCMAPFAGANIALRSGCFDTREWFRCDLGAGGGFPPGEDTELFRQLQLSGKTVYYCGKAVVYHRVAAEKLNCRYVTAWALRNGFYRVRREERKKGVFYFGYPRWIIRRFIWESLKFSLRIFSPKAFIRGWIKLIATLGELIEHKRLNKEEVRTRIPAGKAGPAGTPPLMIKKTEDNSASPSDNRVSPGRLR